MKYKSMFGALLLSLPLLPSLIIEREALNQAITGSSVLLAAPIALEFLSFYFLYAFIKDRNAAHTESEKRGLLVLAIGIFLIIGIPVFIAALVGDIDSRHAVPFVMSFIYAFVSLIVNARRIITTSDKVERYFFHRYLVPGAISVTLTVLLALLFPVTVNAVIAYYILKNFTLTQKRF